MVRGPDNRERPVRRGRDTRRRRDHGPRSLSPREVSSRADLLTFLEQYHRAFPDVAYTVEEVFHSGERYCARWRAEGTNDEESFGISGSGETFSDVGFSTFVVEDGRIAAVRSAWDTLGMVQELGLVSPLGLAAAGNR